MPRLSISLPKDIHYGLIYCAKTRQKPVSGVVAKALEAYLPISSQSTAPESLFSPAEYKETSSQLDSSVPISSAFTPRPTQPPLALSSGDAALYGLIERLERIEEKLYALHLTAMKSDKKEAVLSSGLAEVTTDYYEAQQEVINLFPDSFQQEKAPTSEAQSQSL